MDEFKMKRVAVFVILLVFVCKGENLRCLRCFSTVSAEDCLAGAKPKTCNNGESICLSHEIHSSMKGSRFVLTCGTRRHYQNLQKYCMKPQVSNRVGEVTCKTSLVAPAESEVFTKQRCMDNVILFIQKAYLTVLAESKVLECFALYNFLRNASIPGNIKVHCGTIIKTSRPDITAPV